MGVEAITTSMTKIEIVYFYSFQDFAAWDKLHVSTQIHIYTLTMVIKHSIVGPPKTIITTG